MREVRIKNKTWTHKGKENFKYQVLYPDPKTGTERSAGVFTEKKKAQAKRKEIEQKLYSLTEFGRNETRTAGDLLKAFMLDVNQRHQATVREGAWREKWSMGGKTQAHYEYAIERLLLPRLGDIILIALTFDDCQNCADQVQVDTGSPSTGRRAGTALKTALRWGQKRGWLINPQLLALLPDLRLPAQPKGKKTATPEQLEKIFKVLYGPRPRMLHHKGYLWRRAIWLLFITNGPRRSEVAALRWENIDWERRIGGVEESWCYEDQIMKPTKTPAGDRGLWLADATVAALDDIHAMQGRPDKGLVFDVGKRGRTIYGSLYDAYLKPVLKEAGLLDENGKAPFHWHAMRRTSNSKQAALGVSSKARQVAFGWSDPKMADDIYRCLIPEENQEVRRAVNTIARELVPLRPSPTPEAKVADPDAALARMTPLERGNKYKREWKARKRANGQGADKTSQATENTH